MKSKFNICPVCGKPRGRGPDEFNHGACAEKMAKAGDTSDKVTSAGYPGDFSRITVAQSKKAKDKATRKKYWSGKLPDWMYS